MEQGLKDLALYSSITLTCGFGAAKLGPIAYFGLAKSDADNCKSAFNMPDKPEKYFDTQCYVNAADKEATKNTWGSVAVSTVAWPPKPLTTA